MYNPINDGLERLIEVYGIDGFTLRYAICLLGSYPLNVILKRLPDKNINLKCYYILFMSSVYLFGVMNLATGFRTLFISSMFTYLITRFYKSKFMPYINFMFVMGHLALNHIYAQFFTSASAIDAASSIDITASQMVLVMKLTSFAWSYHDGSFLTKDEFQNDLVEYQRQRSLDRHPSLLHFLAYVFFYPTLLTGPSFDYSDFQSWLNCEMFKDLPDSEKPISRLNPNERRQIPKNGKLALWKVVQGITWIALRSYLPRFCNLEYMLDKKHFMARSFLYRIHYMFFLGLIARFKYYAAWTISEGSCILCGLGYNGYDPKTKKIKWNRVQNINIWDVEMAESTRQCLEGWNMNTNKWLKYSVYLRVAKKGKKPGFRSTLFTFITSAFWHGVNPGYYLTFATGALYQTCGKFYRRNFRPMFLAKDGKTPLKYKWVYDLIGMYVIKLSFGYLVQPFLCLEFKNSIKAWASVYFYGHIIIAVSFFLFTGPHSKQVIKWCKSKQPKEIALIEQKKLEENISSKATSLGDILKEKLEYEEEMMKHKPENDEMNLGIPTIDLEDIENAKKEWDLFTIEYTEWRNKRGFEIEEHNLKIAFENFKREINSDNLKRRTSFSEYLPSKK
ncbi:lysophospholipid acyltransferase [Monosporozyma unispora]|nr:lysophospholipid acyltransferase [Kazachstania unispora]